MKTFNVTLFFRRRILPRSGIYKITNIFIYFEDFNAFTIS